MPTYSYHCSKCEHDFEDFLKIDDRQIPLSQPCPKCGEQNCISQTLSTAAAVVSPFSIEGLKKPKGDFREAMARIKNGHKYASGVKIKDY